MFYAQTVKTLDKLLENKVLQYIEAWSSVEGEWGGIVRLCLYMETL